MARSKKLKKQIEKQLTSLIKEAETVRGSDEFQECLRVAAKFHKYSFGNAMLIAVQKPGATRVAGYRKWQELGRQVRKGEKGIAILAPIPRYKEVEDEETGEVEKVQAGIWFKGVHVFDISQTEGDELPEADWKGQGRNRMLEAAMLDYAKELGIETSEYEYAGGAVGWSAGGKMGYSVEGNVPRTIAHELIHELTPGWRTEMDKGTHESLTDATAAIVCYHFGVDAKVSSANYIAGWRENPTGLLKELEKAQRTASTVIENVAKRLTK